MTCVYTHYPLGCCWKSRISERKVVLFEICQYKVLPWNIEQLPSSMSSNLSNKSFLANRVHLALAIFAMDLYLCLCVCVSFVFYITRYVHLQSTCNRIERLLVPVPKQTSATLCRNGRHYNYVDPLIKISVQTCPKQIALLDEAKLSVNRMLPEVEINLEAMTWFWHLTIRPPLHYHIFIWLEYDHCVLSVSH